ncbi:hypothetical protein A2T98_03270 [Nodularia spumigena CENA596]|uniref:Uncharacterized protein n=1 Tax=Nodularia spumigena CENA596 TaxID=1819295 RepID=A0A166KJQ1_NODSP|nr:hypothetical protein [Nodularia spumigena]KZL51226.1 hypothetical protein A2T98_03270 [Nodularia spumigena CENA596]
MSAVEQSDLDNEKSPVKQPNSTKEKAKQSSGEESLNGRKSTSLDNQNKDTLERIVPFFGKDTSISPEDQRQNFNTIFAGLLGLFLWLTLIGVIIWNTMSISTLSNNFWKDQSSIEEAEKKFEKSSNLINDTSKSLYSLIGPLATAVTSFYYNSMSLSKNSSRDD